MHGYTYAWASKYASSRPLNTVLSSTANTHPFAAATCPRVSIYEYWCLLTQYAKSCVFTSPAYISPADDSNHRLCRIRISEPGTHCSAFHARPRRLSCRFFLSRFSSFRCSPPRSEKVFSIFATISYRPVEWLLARESIFFSRVFRWLCRYSLSLAELKGCFAGCEMLGSAV